MLFGALSCLQGQPAVSVAHELLAAGFDGVQLTPGCAPGTYDDRDVDVVDVLAARDVPTRTHHGWAPRALRCRVWDEGRLLVRADSVHPPREAGDFWAHAEAGDFEGTAVEVMYPGYAIGDSASIFRAMSLGLALAVDVSHLDICRTRGALSSGVLDALGSYDRIVEVHVSAADGRRDAHHPVTRATWGMGWAAERAQSGAPVVLECYMHRLSGAERAAQVALVKDLLG